MSFHRGLRLLVGFNFGCACRSYFLVIDWLRSGVLPLSLEFACSSSFILGGPTFEKRRKTLSPQRPDQRLFPPLGGGWISPLEQVSCLLIDESLSDLSTSE